MTAWAKIGREWSEWWSRLGPAARWLPVLGAVGFLAAHANLGGLRPDHGLLAGVVLAGYYAGPRVRPQLIFLLPILIVGAVYDAQRYWADTLRAGVHVAEPHQWELSWLGLADGGRVVTPAAWLQTRTHAALDLVCGAAYLLFIPVFLGVPVLGDAQDAPAPLRTLPHH